jgi:DNA-binding MarR family transcriptional regulator/GNAT superfamily N-acetyltransferase
MTVSLEMADTSVAEIRAFNRFYTRQIGVLEEHMVESPFSLTEGRVLYEIARNGHTTASDIAKALRLDPAYLHRILWKFAGAGLLSSSPAPGDRRRNAIALTPEGDAAFAELDDASDRAVEAMLAPLDGAQRAELTAAMATIRRLLGDAPPDAPVVLRPHRIGELGWLVHRQGLLYNEQFGWNGEFESLIARIYHEYAAAPESPPKALWVAERAGRVVGSIFVLPSEGREGTAQLRMLYVEPDARGLGLGALLVRQAVDFARAAGYRRVRLWTQSVLVSARRIYEAAGFRCLETNAHHSFGKDLTGEHWELAL